MAFVPEQTNDAVKGPFTLTISVSVNTTISLAILRSLNSLDVYRPERTGSYGKVMFLHVSVILFTGRGLADTPRQVYTPLWADIPWQILLVDPPQGQKSPLRDGHRSGRYTSYWNAFLFNKPSEYLQN